MASPNDQDKPLKRFNIFLPINQNTQPHIANIIAMIRGKFSGCTFSRFHIPAVSSGCKELYGYFIGSYPPFEDEDVCLITVDVSLLEFPTAFEDFNAISKFICGCGEQAVWMTYNDIMLCQSEIKAP